MEIIRVYTELDKEIALILCELDGIDPYKRFYKRTKDEYERWQEGCFLGRAQQIVKRVRAYDKEKMGTTMETTV